MDIKDKANLYHEKGFNCAQGVLCALEEYTGLDEKTALAVSGGFGGGLRCGEVCGAVSGAVMAAGMCCPYIDSGDLAVKEKIAELAKDLTGKFNERFGGLRCADIKGTESCGEFIAFCAEAAEMKIKELK